MSDHAVPARKPNLFPLFWILGLVLVIALGLFGVYRWASTQWSHPPIPPHELCQATIGTETASLTLEQARNASVIAGVATGRGLVPRAVSIALATALQESDLYNLDYGDRDSLGLFQQRPSMDWGTPEEIMDPYYASNAFYDVMVTIDDWTEADIGEVAQEVQRSGFPDAYDKHVERARLLAGALSGEIAASWSCLIESSQAPDPEGLLEALSPAYGKTFKASIFPADATEPGWLRLITTSEETAWSIAAFALSWASETGVSAVSVGQYQWQVSGTVLPGWIGLPESSEPATTVVVVF